MDDDVVNVHTGYVRAHLRYMRRVRNVESPADYLTTYPDFSAPPEEYQVAPLDLVYRIPSLHRSDVMLVLKNPNITAERINEGMYWEDRLIKRMLSGTSDLTERIRALSRVSAPHIADYFVKHPGPQVRMKKLVRAAAAGGYLNADALSDGPKPYLRPSKPVEDLDSPSDVPLGTDWGDIAPVYGDFYVTELCKLRAPTGSWPFHQEERVISKQYLRREIEAVDPTLVVALGKRPSNVLREIAEDAVQQSNATDLYHLRSVNGSTRYLLTLQHPSYPRADYAAAEKSFELATNRSSR